ncbi:MAG: hypothetical protein LZF86_240080 [Nitrospira sp.]|nr:MAG: hypothetical protein LZF86_240080 [Nitrospira sp.]
MKACAAQAEKIITMLPRAKERIEAFVNDLRSIGTKPVA